VWLEVMGYRHNAIGATKGGLRSAECSAFAEKSLLTDQQTAKITLEETLEKRSRTLDKRSSMEGNSYLRQFLDFFSKLLH
jgi:hypothetical protein